MRGGDLGADVVKVERGDTASVRLRYVSPDGDQGYPGTLTVFATYSLNEANELRIEYTATTDRPTIANITNHAYWNLAGEGTPAGAMGHVLTIPAEHYTPVNEVLIPTGKLQPVANTVFDFRKPTPIGARVRDARDPQIVFGKGYDHNFVIARDVAKQPRLMAKVEEPSRRSGFRAAVQPTGGAVLFGQLPRWHRRRQIRAGVSAGRCPGARAQVSPDAPNQPQLGSARLDPGATYGT